MKDFRPTERTVFVGSAVTFDVGSTLTVNGIFGTPTGGTLNLGMLP